MDAPVSSAKMTRLGPGGDVVTEQLPAGTEMAGERLQMAQMSRQAQAKASSTMRTWYGIGGGLLAAAGITFFIIELVYFLGASTSCTTGSYCTVVSSNWPTQGYQATSMNILLGVTVITILVGAIYLVALITIVWVTIFLNTWRYGINGFQHVVSVLAHAVIIYAVAQISGIQDIFLLLAMVVIKVCELFFCYLFEKENGFFAW
jgi:hypothetical protein